VDRRQRLVVAVGDRAVRLDSTDPAAARAALLALQDLPPPLTQPRHPLDHRPNGPPEHGRTARARLAPIGALRPEHGAKATAPSAVDGRVLGSAALGAASAHPAGTPGSYRPPRWMRRLIELRAPRREWPGCGVKAVRCDAEHDTAWPAGPTCPCNLGPCCRRHHRIKQLGWTKTRGKQSTVTWTDPTGRTWHSTSHHEPPQTPVRPPTPIPTPNPFDELSPLEVDDELWDLGLLPDDPGPWTDPHDIDGEPEIRDPLRHRLLNTDTAWTLDLADPTAGNRPTPDRRQRHL
jgi:hypothetical protein